MFHKRKVFFLENNPVDGKSTKNILSNSNLELSDSSESVKKCSLNYKPFLGLCYTFLTSFFMTLTSVFVKQLSYISPGQLSQVRNTGVWVGSLPIAIYSVKNILGDDGDRLFLIARGFIGATALYLNLTAFRYLPLAEAAIIMSSTPAVTTIVARVYLKEKCGLVQSFGLLITICGVLLSVRLPELLKKNKSSEVDSNYIIGLSSAVGCVLLLSVTFVVLRKMKHVHFSVTLLYCGFIGMLENGVINLTTSYFVMPLCGWDQTLVILIGIFGFFANFTLTLAIQAEAVGIVSVMKASLDIVIAMVFQIIFFQSNPDAYNICGALLVIVSVSVIGLSKWVIALPEGSKARKSLRYILL